MTARLKSVPHRFNEPFILAFVHVRDFIIRLDRLEDAAFGRVKRKILSVDQPDAALVAHKIDEHFVLVNVLRPCAVKADARAVCPDEPGYHVVDIADAARSGRPCPHVLENVFINVGAEFVVGVRRNSLNLRAGNVENQIEEVDAPVDENAAA